MRGYFLEDNREAWQKYTPKALWEDYDKMRAAVLAAKDNLYTDSI